MQPNTIAYLTRRLTFVGLIAGLGLLSACNATLVTDPAARNYVPTPGSTVTVKQRIEVPGGQTRIFLQRGELIKKASRLDLYWPNCNFELNTLEQAARTIEPGVYTVTRSQRRVEEVVSRPPEAIQLAAVGIGGGIGRSDGGTMRFEVVQMRLQSDRASDMRELACRGILNDMSWIRPPTLAEIREALGDYASISVPEE